MENRKKRLQIGNKQLQLRFQRRDCLRLGEKMEKNKKAKTEVGYPNGGKEIPTPKAGENPTVTVKGTKTLKKQTATWY